jgi:hypothetical protein
MFAALGASHQDFVGIGHQAILTRRRRVEAVRARVIMKSALLSS